MTTVEALRTLGPEEQARRRVVMANQLAEYQRVDREVKGTSAPRPGDDGTGGTSCHDTVDAFTAGTRARSYLRREVVTGAQQQQMATIAEETAKQDTILDEMSVAAETLRQTASTIGDAVAKSNAQLDESTARADAAAARAAHAVDGVKDVMAKVQCGNNGGCRDDVW